MYAVYAPIPQPGLSSVLPTSQVQIAGPIGVQHTLELVASTVASTSMKRCKVCCNYFNSQRRADLFGHYGCCSHQCRLARQQRATNSRGQWMQASPARILDHCQAFVGPNGDPCFMLESEWEQLTASYWEHQDCANYVTKVKDNAKTKGLHLPVNLPPGLGCMNPNCPCMHLPVKYKNLDGTKGEYTDVNPIRSRNLQCSARTLQCPWG